MDKTTEGKRVIDISSQTIKQLDILVDTLKNTSDITEKEFEKRSFPIHYNSATNTEEWNEKEIRKFYEDPENISRTIYCKEVNVDMTDDWGMFGYTPGFIFIKEKNYKGGQTLADQASSVGLTMGIDPSTGLGLMNHFDFFPKFKYDYKLIRKTEYPKLFAIMCDIVKEKRENNNIRENAPRLSRGAEN